jgi:hypothetical protein
VIRAALEIKVTGSAAGLQRLRKGIGDTAGLAELHSRIAKEAAEFVRQDVASNDDHDSANRLGATPTGHMAKEAKKIGSQSDTYEATILIPRASRLRAAFGSYTVTPGAGHKFLTIPVAKDAYGRRAKEFPEDELFFSNVGPKKTPVLARKIDGRGSITMEVMYLLVTEATIPEDRSLIPFEDLPELARSVGAHYVAELTREGGLA